MNFAVVSSRAVARSAWLLAGALTLGLQACGGGGSDEPAAPPAAVTSLSGTYAMPLTKVQDSCKGGSASNTFDTLSVSQSGATVNVSFTGFAATAPVDADNAGFVAKATQKISGVNVVSTLTFRATGSANIYDVSFNAFAKVKGKSCSLTYAGQARRQ